MGDISMDVVLDALLARMDNEDFAEVCDILSWKFADNGAEMFRIIESWLSGDDLTRIEAALQVNNGFLFRSRPELDAAFADLLERHPRFRARTEEIQRNWDDTAGPKAVRAVVAQECSIADAAARYRVPEDKLRRWVDEADAAR